MASTKTTSTLDKGEEAQLNSLIQQLLSGGTAEQRSQTALRNNEINQVNQQRQAYSKEAAFADAQGLIAQTLRKAMEKSMPAITRGAEGAGASGSAMRALLATQASTEAAQAASAEGIRAATGYGQIGSSLSGILEQLTRKDNSQTQLLLDAFKALAGSKSTTTTEDDGPVVMSGGSMGGGGKTTTSLPNTGSPFGIQSTAPSSPSQGMVYYGPTQTPGQIIDAIYGPAGGVRRELYNPPDTSNLYADRYKF